MKKDEIIYWVSTCIVAISLLISGAIYLIDPAIIESLHPDMGFPDYFKTQLGVCKILGGLAILLPKVPKKIKEFGYAGLTIVLFSACYTHIAIQDTLKDTITPLIIFGILVVSYVYGKKLEKV